MKKGNKIAALILSAAMCVTMVAGCGSKPAASVTETAPVASVEAEAPAATEPVEVKGYGEAPQLADLVSSGALAKVEERIPDADNIFVETVDATGKALSIGTYGGTINLHTGGGSWDLSRPTLEGIIRFNIDGSYYPNVMKEITHNDDYTEWTFTLREGMKWSDGEDFNADDITFWYYMCHVSNFDTKASWTALKDGDDFAKLEKVNDYQVKWTFQSPKFPADFIENGDFKWCWAPEHYLSDLIPDSLYVENPYYPATGLSDEDVLANAQKKGIDQASIKDLGKAAAYNFWNVSGLPTLNSYVLSTKPGVNSKDGELCIMERNAYFWKVDAEGNQLPYCDAISFNKTSEDGQDQLMFRSGELDIIDIGMQDIASILADLGDAAEIREFAGTNWGSYQVTFNYTTEDANFAELFANPKFREAMSICVDRNEVSGLLADGFLEPGQCAPSLGNFGYDAEWEKKWTDFDVEGAKKLLEECGLVMGADGFYDFADGTDLVVTFYTYTDSGADAAYPVLASYYTQAGIKTASKDIDVAAFDEAIDNNEWCAVIGPHTAIGGLSLRSRVAPFVPIAQAAEWYGEYGTYYQTNGEQGVAPTGDMAKLVEVYEKWSATPDPAERDSLTLEIYKIHEQNLWTIAYLKAESNYKLISSKIQNFPQLLIHDDLYQYVNIAHFWTLYKAE